MNIFKKNKWVRAASLTLACLAVTLFVWGVGVEVAQLMGGGQTSAKRAADEVDGGTEYELEIFSKVLTLEGAVFDFINDELDAILQEQGEFEEDPIPVADEDEGMNTIGDVAVANIEKLQYIAAIAMDKIEQFQLENKAELTPTLEARLNKLRFSINIRLEENIDTAERIIETLPAGNEKLGIITSYIDFFVNKDEARVKKYADSQKSWALPINANYENDVQLAVFNAAPVGKKFPNHLANYYSVTQENLSLENFHGKYVLVDFWASWCAPCIAELPYIKEMHSKFSPSKLRIIGISLDAQREAFETFQNNYQLRWLQYFDGKAFDSSLARSYGIYSLPTKFLLDGNGIVVMANNPAREMLNYVNQKFSN